MRFVVSADGKGSWTWWLFGRSGVLAWSGSYFGSEEAAQAALRRFKQIAEQGRFVVERGDDGWWIWLCVDGQARTVAIAAESLPTEDAATAAVTVVRSMFN